MFDGFDSEESEEERLKGLLEQKQEKIRQIRLNIGVIDEDFAVTFSA